VSKAEEYVSELCPGCGVRMVYDDETVAGQRCEDCLCDHEPDMATVTPADGSPGIVDVTCRKCGRSGATRIDPEAIDW
jgi:hypothetical protein